ncbi:MAG TPA: helix-turn-helix transcriptional regulator [Flavihumibacter sp.]|nr:helix-turn-helix transcriptional regulator [Flavihumibacter sp.]HQD08443.1 helix-turn-helix transcriptional regulator [Flavihumibacter sp.]
MDRFVATYINIMNLGTNIRKIRDAKGLSSKEVALSCKMDPAQYSRIENNKTDPALSSLVKIAKALGISIAELFSADEVFKDVNSIDKTLMEKISLIEQLDKKEKAAFFTMLDALVAKKKLKDNLSNALQLAQ